MGNRQQHLIDKIVNIVKVCQRLDQKFFGANHDGNISVKFEDVLLATPTSVSKGALTPEMILTLDMEGNKIEGAGKPFSEIKLHLAAYRCREDAMAVVHAHPPFATARGLIGTPLKPAIPEAVVSIGDVTPVARYALPGAPENDEIISKALAEADVFMIQGNGVLSIGSDIEQAYLRLELVEHIAKIDFYANLMGKPFVLPDADVAKLIEKRASIGLGPKGRSATPQRHVPTDSAQVPGTLKELIAQEIRRVLEGN